MDLRPTQEILADADEPGPAPRPSPSRPDNRRSSIMTRHGRPSGIAPDGIMAFFVSARTVMLRRGALPVGIRDSLPQALTQLQDQTLTRAQTRRSRAGHAPMMSDRHAGTMDPQVAGTHAAGDDERRGNPSSGPGVCANPLGSTRINHLRAPETDDLLPPPRGWASTSCCCRGSASTQISPPEALSFRGPLDRSVYAGRPASGGAGLRGRGGLRTHADAAAQRDPGRADPGGAVRMVIGALQTRRLRIIVAEMVARIFAMTIDPADGLAREGRSGRAFLTLALRDTADSSATDMQHLVHRRPSGRATTCSGPVGLSRESGTWRVLGITRRWGAACPRGCESCAGRSLFADALVHLGCWAC